MSYLDEDESYEAGYETGVTDTLERVREKLNKIQGIVLKDDGESQEESDVVMFVLKSDWQKLYKELGL